MAAESNKEGQSGYIQASELDGPVILDVPSPTADLAQALKDLNSHGCCILRDVLSSNTVECTETTTDQQYAAEQASANFAQTVAAVISRCCRIW